MVWEGLQYETVFWWTHEDAHRWDALTHVQNFENFYTVSLRGLQFLFRRETVYMWDLWEKLHESTQYEAAPAYAHGREALPLWSLWPAFPLLQHAESSPREVFPGQEPSTAGLLRYIQSNGRCCKSRTACRDGNTKRYQPTSAWHSLFSIICSPLSGWGSVTFSAAFPYATLLHWKDRLQEPVTTALYYHNIMFLCDAEVFM